MVNTMEDPKPTDISTLPSDVPKARMPREKFANALLDLFGEYGIERIPVIVLQERGFSPSAWTHQPYWKGTNPGEKAALDAGLIGSLHKTKDGNFLTLRERVAKVIDEKSQVRKTA